MSANCFADLSADFVSNVSAIESAIDAALKPAIGPAYKCSDSAAVKPTVCDSDWSAIYQP